jgi:hypothetical protein
MLAVLGECKADLKFINRHTGNESHSHLEAPSL